VRLCSVAHLFYPDGGFDVFGLRDLCIRMTRMGDEVSVVTWACSRPRRTVDRFDGIEVHRLRGINVTLLPTIAQYPYLFGLAETISTVKPDAILCNSHLFLPSLQAMAAGRSLGIPTVVINHGLVAKRGLVTDLSQWGYLLSVGRRYVRRADCVVCLTNHDKQRMERFGLASRVEVIPNGVDLTAFRPAKEKDPNVVTWVGRMVPEKGLVHLLQAASLVIKEHPGLRIQFVGGGPLLPELKAQASRLGISQNCSFLGWKSEAEVAAILSRSSIFAIPSLSEGLPKALLEAMACGDAIVGSDINQIEEVVDHGRQALLCDATNHQKLADNLLACLEDPALTRRLGAASRLLAEQRFSIEVTARRYHELIDQLVHSSLRKVEIQS